MASILLNRDEMEFYERMEEMQFQVKSWAAAPSEAVHAYVAEPLVGPGLGQFWKDPGLVLLS